MAQKISIDSSDYQLGFSRSSGPGGQNVNKVNSKVTLRFNVLRSKSLTSELRERMTRKYSNQINDDGEIVINSQKYRSQSRNIDDCVEKLEKMVENVLYLRKKRKKTKPTKASKIRRLESKNLRSKIKKLRNKNLI